MADGGWLSSLPVIGELPPADLVAVTFSSTVIDSTGFSTNR